VLLSIQSMLPTNAGVGHHRDVAFSQIRIVVVKRQGHRIMNGCTFLSSNIPALVSAIGVLSPALLVFQSFCRYQRALGDNVAPMLTEDTLRSPCVSPGLLTQPALYASCLSVLFYRGSSKSITPPNALGSSGSKKKSRLSGATATMRST